MEEIKALIELQQLEEKAQIEFYKSHLENDSLNTRVAQGITIYPINIQKKSFGIGSYPFFEAKHRQENTRLFKPGSPVEIFINSEKEPENRVKGSLVYINEDSIGFSIYTDDFPDWIGDGKIGVNAHFDNSTFEICYEVLRGLQESPSPEQKDLLQYFYQFSSVKTCLENTYSNQQLNASQNEAINQILSSNPVSVVHGPPGTGKTTVISEAMKVLSKKNSKILACAPSNAAVNHLALKLQQMGIEVLRLGNPGKMTDEALHISLDAKIKNHEQYKLVKTLNKRADEFRKMSRQYKRKFGKEEREQRNALRKEVKKLQYEIKELEAFIIDDIISNSEVICGTIIGAFKAVGSKLLFDYVFLDEAGQALPSESWICASLGKKLVLSGDPYQLPPTIFSDEASKKGLQISLIENWNNRKLPSALLQVQYRMNDLINEFSNNYFYSGKVNSAEKNKHHVIPYDELSPVEFIDTAGCDYIEESTEFGSLKNTGEVGLVKKVLAQYPSDTNIGIISPYRAQVQLLKAELVHFQDHINTIDSFQGQERDVILISLVRSNNELNIGFLTDYRRMNVAMTRARKKLIIIGDSATIGNDKFYMKLLDFIENQCSYRSAWEFMY